VNDIDLAALTDEEFDREVDARIDQVQAAWDALKASLGPHLEQASTQLPMVSGQGNGLWAAMEAAEAALPEVWDELSRRRDRRLGRR
jgi:hypothetical protein